MSRHSYSFCLTTEIWLTTGPPSCPEQIAGTLAGRDSAPYHQHNTPYRQSLAGHSKRIVFQKSMSNLNHLIWYISSIWSRPTVHIIDGHIILKIRHGKCVGKKCDELVCAVERKIEMKMCEKYVQKKYKNAKRVKAAPQGWLVDEFWKVCVMRVAQNRDKLKRAGEVYIQQCLISNINLI